MPAVNPPQSIEQLVDYLTGLNQRADVGTLSSIMDGMTVSIDEMLPHVRFDSHRYRRNLVLESPWFQMLVLCWRSGQRSPIHNHAGSVCGVKVLKGIATETIFLKTPAGYVKAEGSNDYHAGQVMVSVDQDTHQMSNLQEPGNDLVTMHIYSPPLREMALYSISAELPTDPVFQVTPKKSQYVDGGGI